MSRLSLLVFFMLYCLNVSGQSDGRQNIRIAPGLEQGDADEKVSIRLYTDNFAILEDWCHKNHPEWRLTNRSNSIVTIANVSRKDIGKVSRVQGVRYVDRGNRRALVETMIGDFEMGLNGISAVQAFMPGLTGEGIVVSIKEKPFDQEDLDLRGRVVVSDHFDEASSLHATIMGTVIGGGGSTSSEGKGVAPGVRLTSSDFDNLLPDNTAELLGLGVSLQNHSYGVGAENYYGLESAGYDQQVYENPTLLHVFSSGNSGDQELSEGYYAGLPGFANLTGQFKVSKNTISVGSSDRFGNVVMLSSRGPAHDGRVKPEVIAYGDAGSSEAAAVVSGISTLLQARYRQTYGQLPDAALVKALLINGADDTGTPQVDFATGFGGVNALTSLRTLDAARFFSGVVNDNAQMTFNITVPSAMHKLKITLVWTDPPAEPLSEQALVNDLDLEVSSASAEVYLPWILNSDNSSSALQAPAVRGTDHLNNVEQVTVDLPEPGSYDITVRGTSVTGEQNFFVVYEWQQGFEWLSPTSRSPLHANEPNILRWSWYDDNDFAKIEYRFQSENDWILIGDNIEMAQRHFEWMTPDTTGIILLRITTSQASFTSEPVALDAPQRLMVGFDCEDQVLLKWNSVPSATGYILYEMGEKYLEPYLETTDTFAILNKAGLSSGSYAIETVYGSLSGDRESTIDYSLQGVACYFKSFLPAGSYAYDHATFEVELGTIYNLVSAELQIMKGGQFVGIGSISPLTSETFLFTDQVMRHDLQHYRVKLTTVGGAGIFSQTETVLFIGGDDIYIYPNPALLGEEVSLIVQDEGVAKVEIIDPKGMMKGRFEDFGISKTIPTETFVAGIYMVRVTLSGGKEITGKLMIK